eukprot:CAMPEP_0116039332 /NCGR_PEP_ID=MMETSP0321-20121206/23471_1 /TAXON_ID=163516 /ORGANISM="Leptocylindrus danicus var. danicus, Strain B650" /LENGTH=238 /DNA_ID=CAMNT_0003518477 /DNA_START=34 /DNA_END=747 /DNA_ORIENTATION=+
MTSRKDDIFYLEVLDVLEVLLGFIDVKEEPEYAHIDGESHFYRIHHEIMQQYGEVIIKNTIYSKHSKIWTLVSSVIASTKSVGQRLHLLLVHSCWPMTRCRNDWTYHGLPSEKYFLHNMPHHLRYAGDENDAVRLLGDDEFFYQRMKTYSSFEEGADSDVEQLEVNQTVIARLLHIASRCLRTIVLEDAEFIDPIQIIRAYVRLGSHLQRRALWSASIEVLTEALSVCKNASIDENDA